MSFLIDDAFDTTFIRNISYLSDLITNYRHEFRTPTNLEMFLTSNDGEINPKMRLKCLIAIIGLSEERLKRIVSLVRYKFLDEEFRTEWDIERIARTMQTSPLFRELLVEFFIKGRNSHIGEFIPLYYMRNFRLLDNDFIDSLMNTSYVERILNDNEVVEKYSNAVGAYVEKIIATKLENYKSNKNPNLIYQIQKEFPLLNKNIDFLIPTVNDPIILIEVSHNTTTGSAQSKRADQIVEMYTTLIRHNANHQNRKIILINYCDGFGWVGRQNDLRRIYEASDFVLNNSSMDELDIILDEYYR